MTLVLVFFEAWDVRRGRRNLGAQQCLKHPHAAQNRAGPLVACIHCLHSAEPQEPAPLAAGRGDQPKIVALYGVWDAVELRQAFRQIGVVGGHQFE